MSIETPAIDDMSPEAVMARAASARGDMFPEWRLIAEATPETVALITQTGGYLHKYEGQSGGDQELSVQMRELIATPAICGKSDLRHTPNHVRRMYRLGMTNRVIFEGATAFALVVGWATMLNVAYAIMEATSADYPYGELPVGGEPTDLAPFPELELGRVRLRGAHESLSDRSAWKFAADVDPELVRRVSVWNDFCLAADESDNALLGPGPRPLVVVAALISRGEADRAVAYIRRAYDYGMTKRQVLEAISAIVPMTGMVSVEIGLEAMQRADVGE